ncbi:hypothetical protein SFRURICE_006837, partial [Spodoptera frugiperda]
VYCRRSAASWTILIVSKNTRYATKLELQEPPSRQLLRMLRGGAKHMLSVLLPVVYRNKDFDKWKYFFKIKIGLDFHLVMKICVVELCFGTNGPARPESQKTDRLAPSFMMSSGSLEPSSYHDRRFTAVLKVIYATSCVSDLETNAKRCSDTRVQCDAVYMTKPIDRSPHSTNCWFLCAIEPLRSWELLRYLGYHWVK